MRGIGGAVSRRDIAFWLAGLMSGTIIAGLAIFLWTARPPDVAPAQFSIPQSVPDAPGCRDLAQPVRAKCNLDDLLIH